MDYSPLYVKMCREAAEIQHDKGYLVKGDIYIAKKKKHTQIWDVVRNYKLTEEESWIPRQDEIQAMMYRDGYDSQENLINIILIYRINLNILGVEARCGTFEQLWMHVMMLNCHNKTWNFDKNRWEKISIEFKIEHNMFLRASGDCVCSDCNKPYKKHPHPEKYDWLNILCDETLVKL